MEQIEAELQAAVVDSPLLPVIGAEDIQEAWDALQLSHQRLVIDALVNVRILPASPPEADGWVSARSPRDEARSRKVDAQYQYDVKLKSLA